MESLLLFLDFDGVLHPAAAPAADHFVHRGRFERLIMERPEIRIVISSSWQEAYSIRQLQALFSARVARKVIGGTFSADPKHAAKRRYDQILMYLGPAGQLAQWVALDDTAEGFPPGCPQLVLCDGARGFDAEAEVRLRAKLRPSPIRRPGVKDMAARWTLQTK